MNGLQAITRFFPELAHYFPQIEDYVCGEPVTGIEFFCGAGGLSFAFELVNGKLVLCVNHDQAAIASHKLNFTTEHWLAAVELLDMNLLYDADVLFGSPECFPAGTLILTEQGLIPIEDITVGMKVLTHRNRWMPVTRTMQSTKDTIILQGHGHYGLEVTSQHPLFTRKRRKVWRKKRAQWQFDEPEWKEASELTSSDYWSTPTTIEALPIPPVEGRGVIFQPDFWWMVGRWLGDGSVRFRQHANSEICICCGNHEADELERKLQFATPIGPRAKSGEIRWRRRQVRTATLFETAHEGLARWLVQHFGKLAHRKTIPAWVLGLPRESRQALLDGYTSADGHYIQTRNKFTCSTVSRRLAFGIRLLAESLGYRVALQRRERHDNRIEGRLIKARPFYHISWLLHRQHELCKEEDSHSWLQIKSIRPGRKNINVFNLSVAEDESYVADGIVVHNCTYHTNARGKRLKGQRRLGQWTDRHAMSPEEQSRASMWQMFEAAKIKAEQEQKGQGKKFKIIFVENVVEAATLWGDYDEWVASIKSLGYKYKALFQNSMFAGVPQNRDRFLGVFWLETLPDPDLDFRPRAYCSACNEQVAAIQQWKDGRDKGDYGAQYDYRCPHPACGREVVPFYRSAASFIDFTNRGIPIKDRHKYKNLRPLCPNTLDRIQLGIEQFFAHPQIAPSQVYDLPSSLPRPSALPFWVKYNRNGRAYSVYTPICTLSSHDRCALVFPPEGWSFEDGLPPLEECGYRMLTEDEVQAAMCLQHLKLADGCNRVAQCGLAVPPLLALAPLAACVRILQQEQPELPTECVA